MNLKIFIEKKKKEFIIVAIVLSLVGSVIAAVFSFFNGRIQTIGYIISIVIFGISAVMFCIIAFFERKKEGKKDRIKDRNEAKNIIRVKGQNQRKEISNFGLISLLVTIISVVLFVGGLCMIIFTSISAVRIAGIVIVSVSGFVIFIIGAIYSFIVY